MQHRARLWRLTFLAAVCGALALVLPALAVAAAPTLTSPTDLDARLAREAGQNVFVIRWMSPFNNQCTGVWVGASNGYYMLPSDDLTSGNVYFALGSRDWIPDSLIDSADSSATYLTALAAYGPESDPSYSAPIQFLYQQPVAAPSDARDDIPGCPLPPSLFTSNLDATPPTDGLLPNGEVWRVALTRGETFATELLQLGAPGEPIRAAWNLRLFGPSSATVSSSPLASVSHKVNGLGGSGPMCRLRFTAPATGTYYLQVKLTGVPSGADFDDEYSLRWWEGPAVTPKVRVTRAWHDKSHPGLFRIAGVMSPADGPWGLEDCRGNGFERVLGCYTYVDRGGKWVRYNGGRLEPDGRIVIYGYWPKGGGSFKARVYVPAWGIFNAAWSKTFTVGQ